MQDSSITSFLKTYGILIVALYGVLQVWIIAFWKKFVRKGKLSVFPTGQIEIGYSNFGPTIAVYGTLRAEHKDVFVTKIILTLVRQKDSATYKFDWAAFRTFQLLTSSKESLSIDIPSSFNVSTAQPHRYHIFFSDRTVQEELAPTLNALTVEWQRYMQKIKDQMISDGAPTPINYTFDRKDYSTFSKSNQPAQRAFEQLERKNYWHAGAYKLSMEISTPSPGQTFQHHCMFSLSEAQAEDLLLNSVATIDEICLGINAYRFAFVPYSPLAA